MEGREGAKGENKKEIIKVTNFRSICSDAPLPGVRAKGKRETARYFISEE